MFYSRNDTIHDKLVPEMGLIFVNEICGHGIGGRAIQMKVVGGAGVCASGVGRGVPCNGNQHARTECKRRKRGFYFKTLRSKHINAVKTSCNTHSASKRD